MTLRRCGTFSPALWTVIATNATCAYRLAPIAVFPVAAINHEGPVSRVVRDPVHRHDAHVGLRLLIVDDNESFLKSARELLEGEGLVVCAVAGNGASALTAVDSADPDLVLVDVDLGGESGPAVARQLAAQSPRLHIILVSAYPEEDLPGILTQTTALGFIHKSRLSRRAIQDLLPG